MNLKLPSLKFRKGGRLFFAFLLAILLAPFAANAQNRVSGRVTDLQGNPLTGVVVTVSDSSGGAVTGTDGNYSVAAGTGTTLQFSFLGYRTTDVAVGGRSNIDVTMTEYATEMDEVVVVGYGTHRKESLTGAISNIKNKDIQTTKSPSLAVSLAGKIPGLQIKQQNGMPGEYNTDINIRGMGSPLYVIDGVVRDGSREFQLLNPEDIESISVLKDASAAIYGLNSANGVIIVTTRRGAPGEFRISYNGMVGVTSPSSNIEVLNTSQFYELMNEASVNVGNGPAYGRDELARLQGGPTYDWYNEVFRKTGFQQQHNLTVTGGTEKISTYIGLGFANENGILRSGDLNYNKYSIRSNTQVKVAKNLRANVNLSAWSDKRTQPGTDGNAFMYLLKHVYNIRPDEPVYANNNPEYFNNPAPSSENPVAASYSDTFGRTDWRNTNFQSTVELVYDAPFLKGLQFKALGAYDARSSTTNKLQKQIKLYSYDSVEDEYIPSDSPFRNMNSESRGFEDRMDFQGHISYNNTFGRHDVGALVVFEAKEENYRNLSGQRYYDFFTTESMDMASTTGQSVGGNKGKRRFMSYVGRFNYAFSQKYLVEFAFRYDGSYRYHPDQRWDFFPVVSAGWRISEEKFVKNNAPFITNLKLRGSYGKTGEDQGSAFQYILGYQSTGGHVMDDGRYVTGWEDSPLANLFLSWSEARTADIGLDFEYRNGLLSMEFDVYRRDRSKLTGKRNLSLPNTFGASLPDENLNRDRTDGIEFMLGHRNTVGKFFYNITATFNFARTKTIYKDRAEFMSSWDRYRNGEVGRWNDLVWIYDVTGRYESFDEIRNAPINSTQAGNSFLLPGDYIYEDVNGDGLIDGNDLQPLLMQGTPKMHYGLNIALGWKGFDFNMLWQGSAGSSVKYHEVLGQVLTFNGNSPAFYYDRWHQEDPYDTSSAWVSGYWPATRQGTTNTYSQTDANSFNRKKSTYLRLKNVELGYTFNSQGLKNFGIQNLRLYFNAFNLLVICDKYMKYFDPEISENGGLGYQYPLTRSYNFGVNITF